MLTNREFESIFEAARQRGFAPIDLFMEAVVTTQSSHIGRRVFSSTHEHSGMCLRCDATNGGIQFTASGLDPEKLLRQLKNQGAKWNDRRTPQALLGATPIGKTPLTERLAKSYSPDHVPTTAIYSHKQRRFWIARPEETATEGKDEQTELELRIGALRKKICRTALQDVCDWNDDTLLQSSPKQGWPFPQGSFPIVWSAESVAQILLPFLRAFEGDLVLSKRSFISLGDFPCRFQLLDEKPSSTPSYDSEGSLRTDLHFFDGKTPRLVPCNREIAKVIGLSPTGHSRRESFLAHPTIGLWNVRLVEDAGVARLLTQISNGIYVKDVTVTSQNLLSPEVLVSINDSRLIHQGEIGECLEPVSFKIGLGELLASLHFFEKDQKTFGHQIEKMGQTFLMEVTTGSGLSEGLSLPGTVPSSHYWG